MTQTTHKLKRIAVRVAAAAAALSFGAVALADAPKKYDAEVFFNTTDISIAGADKAYSPDGDRLLITTNATGTFNAATLDLATGAITPLTNSTTNSVFAVSYFPDDSRVLYTFDEGGNELNHIYVRGEDGKTQDLTPGENVKAAFVSWIEDGAAFVVQTNERDPKFFDLYRYDTGDYARSMIFQNNAGLGGFTIRNDGKLVAASRERTSADNNLFLIDLAGEAAEPKLITAHEGNVSHVVYDFTPAGDKLIFGTDEYGEFTQSWTYDVATGERQPLIEAAWDVMYVDHSPSGRYRVSAVNADAATQVTITDTKTGKPLTLPANLPKGDLRQVRFSPDEKQISFLVNADTAPSNVITVDLKRKKFRQLTNALNPAIAQTDLVTSEVVRYPSFDGLEIPSILYKPHGASAKAKVPAVVLVHGGPGGQTRTGYSAMVQHLVNHGFAVLGANNRGSSGYGKTFFHMDDRKHGEVDLQDIVYGRKYLETLDWVDGENIAIMGGSYGGYMVAAALAFEPEAFDAGVNIFGVTNWVRTLESIPPWWEAFREALFDEMGDPATDAERHRAISPLFHAKNIVKPLLVVQGANDPRVLQVESDELVAAVKKNGVPVEYLVFPDEGHGFLKRENRIAASNAYVGFLSKYLKGEEAVASATN